MIRTGSTTFFVRPGEISVVNLGFLPAYSVLWARFVSNSAKTAPIIKLELSVGGVVVDDTNFSGALKKFDVTLSYKYLRTGATTMVELRASNASKKVKYFRAVPLHPAASADSEVSAQITEDGGD